MSDLLNTMLAASAAASASEAATESKQARQNTEESLESGYNTFYTFTIGQLVDVSTGWFSDSEMKFEPNLLKVSLKRTDVAYLSENKDDFGTIYTTIHLEDRCDLNYRDFVDSNEIYVAGPMEKVQSYLNK